MPPAQNGARIRRTSHFILQPAKTEFIRANNGAAWAPDKTHLKHNSGWIQ
jgi:hypothetical protein